MEAPKYVHESAKSIVRYHKLMLKANLNMFKWFETSLGMNLKDCDLVDEIMVLISTHLHDEHSEKSPDECATEFFNALDELITQYTHDHEIESSKEADVNDN